MRSPDSAPEAAAAAAGGLSSMLAAKELEEMQQINDADELELPVLEWGTKAVPSQTADPRADRRQSKLKRSKG